MISSESTAAICLFINLSILLLRQSKDIIHSMQSGDVTCRGLQEDQLVRRLFFPLVRCYEFLLQMTLDWTSFVHYFINGHFFVVVVSKEEED